MKRLASALLALLVLVLTACGSSIAPTAAPQPTAASAATTAATTTTASSTTTAPRAAATPASSPAASGAKTKLTIALGYIPDIQFAPFYVAAAQGYYADEGLDVDFKQGLETDVLKLVGTNALSFGVASGDEVMVARSQGVPVTQVATWYQKYPVSVVAPEKANIHQITDLKGHTVGVPGRYGATYVGLLALLNSAGLSEKDIQLREVGFQQVQALTQGQVDAIVGYTNNEPVQLREQGQAITTLNLFDYVNLVSNGLVTNEQTIKGQPELVRKVVRATLRGLQATIAQPDQAVDICIAKYIPEAAGKRAQVRDVLMASIPLWQSQVTDQHGLGYSDPAAWTSSRDLLRKLGVLGSDIDLAQTYTNDFLPPR
ncbi:MAG: ABC transporter substrate-binding protein [Thermomicrobiales bacterium]|nr:ABC transporter substrate-binding protein [Thermomicrobiales bacterium]